MSGQESVFENDGVGDYIIEAIQRRFFPETGKHFDELHQSIEMHMWREFPSDRPEE